MADIRIVLPPVWPGIFNRIGELFFAAARSLALKVEMVEAKVSLDVGLNIIIGWSVFEPFIPSEAKYVLYQLEPLHHSPWSERLIKSQHLFERALAIWDYSQINLPLLKIYPSHWVPLRYHPALYRERTAKAPQWDVLFSGNMTPRRHKLLQELSRHCCVSAEPRWGEDFEQALMHTKILLNIHQVDAPTPLEQPRISFALNNNCFVLSENAADQPYAKLSSASYAQLTERTLNYLHNPEERKRQGRMVCAEFAKEPTMTETLAEALNTVGIQTNS